MHDLNLRSQGLEPLAVIGFSLKFPQEATSAASFWRMLEERRCAMTEWPTDRISLDSFYDGQSEKRGTLSARGAHFLAEDIAGFDASFFSISQAEAVAMDPQHRFVLETAYHALESAGIPIEKVHGSKTGVYTGSMSDDYKMMLTKDLDDMPKYAATGASTNFLANRLSWFFNVTGPSISMDSACSSSLAALDIACQGLRNGDSSMALVAGSNIILSIEIQLSLTSMGFLSPDSRCYSFDERANGYSRGEGFGVVVIKRVSDAIRDGDTIRAVIRSTGVNSDGYTPGITQPSTEAQESLIRETYRKANIDLEETRFFEAHGTGTAIGDPIEAEAIGRVFRSYRSASDPLYIGALKSNIGHLEGGSGIAGLIKTILVLEKGLIPPNANFENLNSKIDAEYSNLRFSTELTPWPGSGLRRASVNSFGFGGTNSHAVLEDAYNFLRLRNLVARHCTAKIPLAAVKKDFTKNSPDDLEVAELSDIEWQEVTKHGIENSSNDGDWNGIEANVDSINGHLRLEESSKPRLLVWSAADEKGVGRMIDAYDEHFTHTASFPHSTCEYLDNLAYTLALRRSSLPWRSYAVVDSKSLFGDLKALVSTPVRSSKNREIVFVFTGQGAQYRDMGLELLEYQVFRNTLRSADEEFRGMGSPWSLFDFIGEPQQALDIDDPQHSQPLCTALQIALVELLLSFNITPSTVVGHSSGEIAAAYTLGALSLRSACRVSYVRGKLASRLAKQAQPRTSMMSINLSESDAELYIRKRLDHNASKITIACINSDSNVTISGDDELLNTLKSALDAEQIFARKITTGVGYHSPVMEQIGSEYESAIAELEADKRGLKLMTMISTVTGDIIPTADILSTAKYWVDNMVMPVKFSQALSVLLSRFQAPVDKIGVPRRNNILDLIEIGPHSTLQRPVKDLLEAYSRKKDTRYHSVLSRFDSSLKMALKLAGDLFSLGYSVVFTEAQNYTKLSRAQLLTDLPEYPFNHSQKFWHESRTSKSARLRVNPSHDFLGSTAMDWNHLEPRWRKRLSVEEMPWIEDHKVNGTAIYPASGMIVMAVEGARQLASKDRHTTGFRLKEAIFSNPIPIQSTARGTEIELYMCPTGHMSEKEGMQSDFRVCINQNDMWVEACRGIIQVQYDHETTEVDGGREDMYRSQHCHQKYAKAVTSCRQIVPPEHMYQHFQDIGYTYGPAFQVLQSLAWGGSDVATAEIKTFASNTHEQPYSIHPITLDAAAQLMWLPLTEGATKSIPTAVPTLIRNAWISSSGLGYPEQTVLRAYTRSTLLGRRGTKSSMFALDGNANVRMSISHLETTIVSSQEAILQGPPIQRQLCYGVDWTPHIASLSPKQLLKYCKAENPSNKELVRSNDELDRLSLLFMSKFLEDVTEIEIQSSKPFIRRYIDWMRIQVMECQSTGSSKSQSEQLDHFKESLKSLTYRVGQSSARGRLYVGFGHHLRSIVRGDISPAELISHGSLAEDYHQELYDTIPCCRNVWNFVDALAHENPALQVLEVGAGTGSLTGHVIPPMLARENGGIARYSSYDYTHTSSDVFEKARVDCAYQKQKVRFKLLDIERDLSSQGFEPESYDLIVASNLLYTTKHHDSAAHNLRRLLKPGGMLLLFEVTEFNSLRTGFLFGALQSQPSSVENSKTWSPEASKQYWDRILRRNGFTGADVVFQDYQDDSCHERSVILSKAAVNTDPPPSDIKIVILVESASDLQTEVAYQLQSRLKTEALCVACDILQIGDTSSNLDMESTTFVCISELDKSFLCKISSSQYKWIHNLLSNARRLLWATHSSRTSKASPEVNMISGLLRVLRSENVARSYINVAFEDEEIKPRAWVHTIVQILQHTGFGSLNGCETEYAERNGLLTIPRVTEAHGLNQDLYVKTVPQRKIQSFGAGFPLKLTVATRGLLDSLQFVQDPDAATELGAGEVEIKVEAVGVNFRDLFVALGRFDEETFGCECAGFVNRLGAGCADLHLGDRVCAAAIGCLNTYARSTAELVVKIPNDLSFVKAAAIPITGVTAYYSLIESARLRKGESVLIHSGSGGTGQMAIQIAQSVGAEVFTTVGFDDKKELLKGLYNLPDDHILYSRNTTFAEGIMRLTKGRGVDVVLNSLSGDNLVASWESIAPFGRFIEIGKADIKANSRLPMACFAKNVSFSAIEVDYMCVHRPTAVREALLAVMNMIEGQKIVTAQPLHIYPVSKVETAFRFMQSGRNTGKVVLTISPTDHVPTMLRASSSYYFDPSVTYLIAGGLGGLGRSAARWMARKGARNLILLSRTGPRAKVAFDLLDELKNMQVQVQTPQCDVSSGTSLSNALAQCLITMPPIKGCIQGTMVLRDALYEKMSFDDWSTTVQSKVQSSWNLHELLPKGLDFFIMLSSVSGVIGSIGQANYAAGNTYQDKLAEFRVLAGEKATSLALGWMGDVGVIAENEEYRKGREKTMDMAQISEDEFHALLDHYCDPKLESAPPSAPWKSQSVIGLVTPLQLRSRGLDVPEWTSRPTFRPLAQIGLSDGAPQVNDTNAAKMVDYAAKLSSATSLAEAGNIILEGLVQKLSKVLSVPAADLDTSKPLHVFGVDSLLAVELRNWFAKEVAADVAIFDFMGESSVVAVSMVVASKSQFRRAEWTDG